MTQKLNSCIKFKNSKKYTISQIENKIGLDSTLFPPDQYRSQVWSN